MAQPNSSRTGPGATGGSDVSGTSHSTTTNGDRQHDRTLADRVRDRAAATLESQKDRATDGLGSVARAVRSTEDELRRQHHESVAEYVAQVANQIDRLSTQLREKRVDELVNDAQRFARRHPAAFAGSAFALGVMTARFLKSSGERTPDRDEEHGRTPAYREPHSDDLYGTGASRAGAPTTSSVYGSSPPTAKYGGSPGAGASPDAGGTRGSSATFGSSESAPGPAPSTSRGASSTVEPTTTPSAGGTSRGRRPGPETERS